MEVGCERVGGWEGGAGWACRWEEGGFDHEDSECCLVGGG